MLLSTEPVAILGATSRIAQDFICNAHKQYGATFALYARRPEAVRTFIADQQLRGDWIIGSFDDFSAERKAAHNRFGAVINFVGIGDPAKAVLMGSDIFRVTAEAEHLALNHLRAFPETRYVFLSSGSVYGADFRTPVDQSSAATVPVNSIGPESYYGIAKLHAEATHRAMAGMTITDIRVFNYISRMLDPNARFFVTDIISSIVNKTVLKTTQQQMVRDYLHPHDFCALVAACLDAPRGTNEPVDAYSKEPIGKMDLLDLAAAEFGLRYEFVDQIASPNATGAKAFYYSTNRHAAARGYTPRYTSAEGLALEIAAIIAGTRSF